MSRKNQLYEVMEEFKLENVTLKPGDVIQEIKRGYSRADDSSMSKFQRLVPAGGTFVVDWHSDLFKKVKKKF